MWNRSPPHCRSPSAPERSSPTPAPGTPASPAGSALSTSGDTWIKSLRDLRYQSFQSHPEARPERDDGGYVESPQLGRKIRRIGRLITDEKAKKRIPRMLSGYFADMYVVLKEIQRVLVPGGKAALVLGNVRYCGVPIEVDHFTAKLGAEVGFVPEVIYTTRRRGNSAQQMREHGRTAA